MLNLVYTLCIGIPVCVCMMTVGVLLCCTIIFIPVGLTAMALGFKMLTLGGQPKVVVRR